jgi:hypothetical protein
MSAMTFWLRIGFNHLFFNAPYSTSTGCTAILPVPSFIWWRQLVPGAAMITFSDAALTAGNNTSSPTCIDKV